MRAPETVSLILEFEDLTVGHMHFVTAEYGVTIGNRFLPDMARWRREASPANVESEILRSSFGKRVVSWRPLALGETFPTDRTYRNALRFTLEHDMEAARAIHRDMIRRARAPLLEALDAEVAKSSERTRGVGVIKALTQVYNRKQALRDATKDPRIDKAKTIQELKAAWPEVLGPKVG